MWVNHTISTQLRFDSVIDPLAQTGGYHWSHIANLASILKRGLLSRNSVIEQGLKFSDPSIQTIQTRRSTLEVYIGGSAIHDYANLLWHPRNAGTFRVIKENGIGNVVIAEYDAAVQNLPGTVATHRWAPDVLPYRLPSQGQILGERKLHSDMYSERFPGWDLRSWYSDETDEFGNRIKNSLKSSFLQAELLIPKQIPSDYISRLYVGTEEAAHDVLAILRRAADSGWIPHSIAIIVCEDLFFTYRPGASYFKPSASNKTE